MPRCPHPSPASVPQHPRQNWTIYWELHPTAARVQQEKNLHSYPGSSKEETLSPRLWVNSQPLHEAPLLVFQRLPGFPLLAKHGAAVHKVVTLAVSRCRQREIKHPPGKGKHALKSGVNPLDATRVIAHHKRKNGGMHVSHKSETVCRPDGQKPGGLLEDCLGQAGCPFATRRPFFSGPLTFDIGALIYKRPKFWEGGPVARSCFYALRYWQIFKTRRTFTHTTANFITKWSTT